MKPGYKQTEVGVIPEDWEVACVSDVINSFQNGFAFASEGYVNSGIPIVTMVQIGLDGTFNFNEESVHFWPADTLPTLKQFCLYCGDVIIAMTDVTPQKNLIGRMAEVTETGPLLLNQRVGLIRTNPEKTNSYFIRSISNSSRWRNYARAVASLGVQANISTSDILKGCLPLPPLPEQRAIAGALSDVDALLGAQEALLAKKRDLKAAAMQPLLSGETRLPGFTVEWQVKRLGEVATFYKGKGLPKSELCESGAELCIHYGELFTRYPATIAEIFSSTNATEGVFRSVANDVLMPTSDVTPRGLAKASCVNVDGVILGGDILVIRSDTTLIRGSFLSLLIRHEETQVLQLVTGSTVYHLYGSDMKNFTFSMPPLSEQTAIAAVLSDMDAEIVALEAQRDKTRALKQGMMQELLTGRIRLL